MGKFHKNEIFIAWICLFFIIAFYGISLVSLSIIRPDIEFSSSPVYTWSDVFNVIYQVFLRYFKNTFIQASISATVILVLGFSMAKALVYLRLGKFRNILLTITNASFSLPTILVIFALINILGRVGWLNQLLAWLGLDWRVSIFGLFGIVLANTYFNIGYTATALYNNLQKIPLEQIILASQCNFGVIKYFRLVELPYLKSNILNLWLLMFMLCFNSFALLLFLGGGPKYANFEVGIYNALTQDLDFTKAMVIAGTQILFSLVLIILISLVKPDNTETNNVGVQEFGSSNYIQSFTSYAHTKKVLSYILGVILIIYIGLPLLSLVFTGIYSIYELIYNYYLVDNTASLASTSLGVVNKTLHISGDMFHYSWSKLAQASGFSLIFASGAAVLCTLVSVLILRGFRWLGNRSQMIVNNMSLLGLAIPNMLLGAGYYVLFNIGVDYEVGTTALVILIILATSFSSIAYSLNYLSPAYKQIQGYERLSASLGFSSWQRFKIYEFKLLRNSLVFAFINIFVLALGDFSIILFFVNNDLTSITYLLASQLGGFKSNQGNITALVLLILIIALRFIAYSSLLSKRNSSDSLEQVAIHH